MIRIASRLACVVGLVCASSCRSSESGGPSASPAASASAALLASGLRVVDPRQVCMVNDRFMGTAQIPTQVEGRTYYGCCAMCSGRLRGEPAVRSAKDPVSGHEVDKARAVIAAAENGSVLYFESDKTLAAYRPPERQ